MHSCQSLLSCRCIAKSDFTVYEYNKARIFLLVDIQDFFLDLGWGDERKKSSENDQLTGHFQSW